MAITFKYGAPGPILQAGFAAGVGRRQQRQQDDALEIWEQQNQQQFQAGQAAINRQFQFGMQQQQFGQALALQDKRFEQETLQDQEQRTFQAGQAELGRTFQAGEGELDRKFQAGLRDDATRNRLFFSMPDIPEHADADKRKALTSLRTGIQELLLGPGYDRSDPDVQEKLKKAMRDYSEGVGAIRPPSAAEAANRGTVYADEQGTFYDKPAGPGEPPRTAINPLLEGRQKEQDDMRKQQAEQAKQFQADTEKYAKAVQADAERQAKAAADEGGDLTPYIAQAKKNLAAVGFREPQRAPNDWGDVTKPTPVSAPQPQAAPQQPTATTQQPAAAAGKPKQGLSEERNPTKQEIAVAAEGKSVAATGVSGKEAQALMNELDPRNVGKLHDDDLRYIKSAVGQGVFPPELEQAATEEYFTRSWKKVSPGGSVMGPDGKMYIKRRT